MKRNNIQAPQCGSGFHPVEGESTTAMVARLKADPEVMTIFRKRYPGAAIASGLREAREAAGLTQEQVAKLMETTRTAVSRLESPESHYPSMRQVMKYTEAIGANILIEIQMVGQTKSALVVEA